MSSARGRGNGDDDLTEYERQKWEQVARNHEKMESLRLKKMSTELQPAQPTNRIKVCIIELQILCVLCLSQ
jgi:hypothetical protein